MSNLDKMFYVWDSRNKKYLKAIFAKDCEERNPGFGPRKLNGYYSAENCWINGYDGYNVWTHGSKQYWKGTPRLIFPPKKPSHLMSGFWVYTTKNHWRFVVHSQKGRYDRYYPDGLSITQGETKEYLESTGYIFPPEEFINMGTKALTTNPADLQNRLIEYCMEKPHSRRNHLMALTQKGALNTSATYDEVAKIISDYLNTEQGVCTDGAARALKTLGLEPEKKFVKRTLSVSDILFRSNKGEDLRFARSGDHGSKGMKMSDKLHKALSSCVPSGYEMEVWVKE